MQTADIILRGVDWAIRRALGVALVAAALFGAVCIPVSLVALAFGVKAWVVTIAVAGAVAFALAAMLTPPDMFGEGVPAAPALSVSPDAGGVVTGGVAAYTTFDEASVAMARAILDDDMTAARAIHDYLLEHPELLSE